MKRFPLSPAQQVVWLHEQRWPHSSVYHFTARVDLSGHLDVAALRAAIADVVAQHAAYRTALAPDSEPAGQVTADEVGLPWREIDLSDGGGPAFDDVLREHMSTPFDLHHAPLARWTLVRTGDADWHLLHTEHHLIHDGMSFMTFLRDLAEAYPARLDGRAPALTDGPGYAEYVESTTRPDHRQAVAAALEHWRRRLDGAALGTTVPGTRGRTGGKRFVGAQHELRLPPELAADVRRVGGRGGTPFGLLFGVFADLVRRYSGARDVVIGSTVGNRPPGYEHTVGMFVNTLPVRLDVSVERDARRYGRDGALALLDALRGQDAPIQEITRAVGASGAGTDNPLFRIMFSAHDAGWPELDLPGLACTVRVALNLAHSRMDIDVVVITDDRAITGADRPGMTLLWDYDTDRYDHGFIERMAQRYSALLAAAVTEPERPLHDIPLALGTPADSVGDGGPGRTVALAPAGAPDTPAIHCGPMVLTYGQLDQRVDELAGRLRDAGVGAGHRVAALLPRGVSAVLTLLACLRLRAVWCPVPVTAPAGRRQALVDRLRPTATVTETDGAPTVTPATDRPRPWSGDTAYVLHTSGSTGGPKAVLVDRAALANHVAAVADVYALHDGDRVLQFAQPHFDVVLEEILPTLCRGGTLVIPRAELVAGTDLAALLLVRGVTVVNLPTGYLGSVLTDVAEAVDGTPLALRLVVIGGERAPAALAERIRAAFGAVDIRNAYGVTEATVTTTIATCATITDESHELPIGRPLPGTRVYLLDDAGRPLPTETVGEIAIGGAGVAAGYLGDPARTDDRFRPDPYGGGRIYRTGDLGHWRADGQLCFLGRRDNQVKFGGHRIELEEIESAIGPLVGGARRAVLLDEDWPGTRLVGFVESAGSAEPPDTTTLGRALADVLPPAMIPSRWVVLPELPANGSDKIDRGRLRKLLPDDADQPTVRPDEPWYPAVRAVWAEVLGGPELGPESNFFRHGGHSLLAIQITARLRAVLGREVPLGLLFEHPVLADFAATLAAYPAPAPT